MYTLQIRFIDKEYRRHYIKRQYRGIASLKAGIYKQAYNPEAIRLWITAWDADNDVLYYQKDDYFEAYDIDGNLVDDVENIGRGAKWHRY